MFKLKILIFQKCKEGVKTRYCMKDTDVSQQHFSGSLPPEMERFLKNMYMLANFQKDGDNLESGSSKKKRAISSEFPRRMPDPVYC